MMDDRAAKKALQSNFDGIRARGRLQKRSKDTVEENVQKLGVTRWRSVAEDCLQPPRLTWLLSKF